MHKDKIAVLQSPSPAIGKTIKHICFAYGDTDAQIIVFTDDTVLAFGTERDSDDSVYVKTVQSLTSNQLQVAGLLTEEECNEDIKEWQANWQKQRDEQERRQYEHLQKKFG